MAITLLRRGQSGSYNLNKRFAEVAAALGLKAASYRVPNPAVAAPVNAVAATLATALTGVNNDLVFTAKTKGTAAHAITVAYVDPSENDAELAVTVTGTAISVSLATGAAGAITTTAAQVKAAIEATPAAHALVAVAAKDTDTLAAAVTAMAAAPLANGVNGSLGAAWEQRYYNSYVYLCASDDGNTVADTNWKKWQLAAA